MAVERIDDLLSVPGVDVALIGPEDLSLSMGVPGQTGHPLVVEAIEKVILVRNAELGKPRTPGVAGIAVERSEAERGRAHIRWM